MMKGIVIGFLAAVVSLWAPAASLAEELFPEVPAQSHKAKSVRGQLRPVQYAVLASGISARLNTFPVKPGDLLEKGQEIAQFECGYERAEETVVRSRLAAALAKLEVNRRLEKLHNVSGLEVRLSQAEVDINMGEVGKIEALLKECRLLAPFSGTVVAKFAQAHQFVNKGDPLLELVNNQSLEVEMVIPSHWLLKIQKGVPFSIHLEEIETTLSGTIARVIGIIDPVSQTVHVMGMLEDSAIPLLLGMSGVATFEAIPVL